MKTLYISYKGYTSCPSCARFVKVTEDLAAASCPFCGQLLAAPLAEPKPGSLAGLALMGGRSAAMAAEFQRASAGLPNGPRRDPHMTGDPSGFAHSPTRDEIEEEGTPLHAVWELTLACDLKCIHCGSRAGRARKDELSTAEALDLVQQLAELGIREVTLIGGEAYLRRDWTQIAARITKLGMGCTMTTGARNLNDRRLAEAIDAGVGSIGISVDGLEATHDTQRGVPGSFRAALDAAQRVTRSPIRLTTNTQVNAISAPELPGIARLLQDVGSAAWQLQLTVAMGNAADRPELLLQPYHLLECFPMLVWIREQILLPAGIELVVGNNIGYFGPYEAAIRYGAEKSVHWSACGAGTWVLGIEADGTIKGCPSLATKRFAGGNVRETALAEIVRKAPELTQLGKRSRASLSGFCRSCYYADVCLGGCSWTTDSLLGQTGNNPYCIHRALELERRGLRESVVKVEAAAGEPFDTGRFELRLETVQSQPLSVVGVPIEQVVQRGSERSGLRRTHRLAVLG